MTQANLLVEFMRRAGAPSIDWEVVGNLPWTMINVSRQKSILRPGDRPTDLLLVHAGWAGRYSLRRNGTRRVTGFMLPGDLCGIHALTGTRMDHSVIALTDCEVAKVSAATIALAIQSTPSLGRALWHSKLMDEAILRKWLLNSEDANLAVAHFLCEMHARLSAIGEVKWGNFQMRITQADIGGALGLTAVHTNRMLRQLRQAELVTAKRERVIIGDIEKLREHCNFDPSYLHF